jgi:hypothetical protein
MSIVTQTYLGGANWILGFVFFFAKERPTVNAVGGESILFTLNDRSIRCEENKTQSVDSPFNHWKTVGCLPLMLVSRRPAQRK